MTTSELRERRARVTGIPDPEHQPTMNVEEAGEVLGISRASAYSAAKRGEIPTIRIGRRVLVPTAALRRMLDGDPREVA